MTPSAVRVPPERWSAVPPVAVPVVLATLVVLPWVRQGWLLLLDWIPGPGRLALPRSFWGLDGGLQAALPFALVTMGVSRVVGAAIAGWAVIAVALAGAGVAAGRLVEGPPLRRVAAGALYVVNPMVFERVGAGQVGFLLAYAALPMLAASIIRRRGTISWAGMRPALWLALAVALSPHLLWLGIVVLVASVLTGPTRLRALGWAGLVLGLTLLMSAYVLAPGLGRPVPLQVGERDLMAFRTRADPTLGLAPNVAALHGFWRVEPQLPKQAVGGWPLFLAAIVGLSVWGLWRASRDEATRQLAAVLVLSGLAGLFLAMGDQGPTGPAFRWAFDHVPGFAIMREPQKFVALLALAYAAGFALAVDYLARTARRRKGRWAAACLSLVLPILYVPTLFFGLNGQIGTSRYPASWSSADRLMASGEGKVLFLPWHQYMSFPFTGRVIGNPADAFFRRPAVSGDNVELSNLPTASNLTRSAYLEFLYEHGGELCAFGRLVAPLGVEYVALARTVDWQRYRWLDRQVDLEKVLDTQELVVFRNRHYVDGGRRDAKLGRTADWGALATLANTGTAVDLYTVDAQAPGAVASEPCRAGAARGAGGDGATRTSPVEYRVPRGPAGYVALPETFDPSWRHQGRAAIELAGGTVGLRTDGTGGTAQFGHWSVVRLAYATSLVSFVGVLAGGLRVDRRAAERRPDDVGEDIAPDSSR